MAKLWEYEPKRLSALRNRSAFRLQASRSAFTRLAGDELRRRGIDPGAISSLSPSRALDVSGPGTQGELFSRTVKRLTSLGLAPEEAVKRVRQSLDTKARRVAAGMVEPSRTPASDLEQAQQGVAPFDASASPSGVFTDRFSEEAASIVNRFRSDLAGEGFEPWMIDTQLQGQIRLAGLFAEELEQHRNPREGTPAFIAAQNDSLKRLDEEMGELLREAQPEEKRGLFSRILFDPIGIFEPGESPGEKTLKGGAAGVQGLESAINIGLRFRGLLGVAQGKSALISEQEQLAEMGRFDVGEAFRIATGPQEVGARISRPVASTILTGIGAAAGGGEFAFEEVAGVPARGKVSGKIKGQVAEDILTEVINPANILIALPFIGFGTKGLRGLRLAEQMTANLLATGLEPRLARGTLRGLSILGKEGIAGAARLSRAVRETPVIQQVLKGIHETPEAGGGPLGRTARQQAVLLSKESMKQMPKSMLDEIAKLLGAPGARSRAKVIEGIRNVQVKEGPALRKVLVAAQKEQEEALRTGVKQAAAPPHLGVSRRGRPDIVEKGLEDSAARARATQASEFRRSIKRAVKPPRPGVPVSLKLSERDWTGDALQRLSEAPDNPVPILSRRDLPELSQFDDQLESALRFRDQARETLEFNRSTFKAGMMSLSRVSEATLQLAEANKQLKAARSILKESKIRATRGSVMNLVRGTGGSEETAGIIARAFDASIAMVPHEDSLLTAASWRQRIARGLAAIKGRIVGDVGILADQRTALLDAMRLQTGDESGDLFRGIQRLLEREADGITYTGPAKFAEMAEGEYKLYHIVQHPDWFTGKSAKLDSLLLDAQLTMRGRLEQARALGYPIEALDGAYLEQLWDIPRSPLEAPVLRAKGKVSIAQRRWFDDYFEGLSKGGKPRNLTVEELMQHSSSLLDEAIADAWMRQEVLRRYGTRAAKVPALKGARKFGHPLYQGWSAPTPVTNAVDQLYNPVGVTARNVGNVAATMKNTAFGLVDIAVGGVQFPLSLAHGGLQIGVGTLNRSLQALGMPYIHVALQDTEVVGRVVQYAEDTLHIGIGPSSVRLGSGTIVKYIPVVGPYIDKPLSAAIDFMARMQFGHALTAVRVRMYEGNLIAAKFIGQDITDPKVRRFWAEAANAQTGAARGAQTPGRRAVEAFALTSAPMTRANLSVYGQIAQGLTVGGRMQKLRSALVLTNLAAYTYGIQYLVNSVFGNGPQEWIPGRPEWATIRVKGETIPLIPQRSLLRAIDKSLQIIMEGVEGEGWRPEDIALAWSQVMVGKSSPAVQALLSPAGIGFEPDTGRFQLGTLSPKGRALGIPPTPPLAEQVAFQETDALSLVLAGVGFNPYPTSSNRLLREEWKITTGKDFNDEVDWIVADSHPELSVEFSPMVAAVNASSLKWGSLSTLRRDRIEQFRAQEEVASGLEQDAEAFLAGEDVGRVLIGDWLDHQAGMSSAISFSVFGDDREPETPEGKALKAWGEIQPEAEKYRDPITRDIDRDAYRADKDAAFEAIRAVYPELAEALEARTRAVSPNLVKVEPDILRALDALSDYREIDRWFGIDKEMENKVEDIHRMIDRRRDELALQGFVEVNSGDVYRILIEERPDIPKDVWQAAWLVRPGADANYRNPVADRFLIDNDSSEDPRGGLLRRFFPDLYRRSLLAQVSAGGNVTEGRQLAPALRTRLGLE